MGDNKHLKEKEKTVSKPKGSPIAKAAYEKGSKNVKQKDPVPKLKVSARAVVVSEKYSKNVKHVSVRKETSVVKVVQSGNDVIVRKKVTSEYREEVTTNKEAARRLDKRNHKVRVQENRPLPRK